MKWEEPESINQFPPGSKVILNPKLGYQFIGKEFDVTSHQEEYLHLDHDLIGNLTIHFSQANTCPRKSH
jgi:hypothetical protein